MLWCSNRRTITNGFFRLKGCRGHTSNKIKGIMFVLDISQSEIDALLKDMGKNNQIDKGVDQGVSGDREPKAVSLEADNTGPVVEKVEFAQLKEGTFLLGTKGRG